MQNENNLDKSKLKELLDDKLYCDALLHCTYDINLAGNREVSREGLSSAYQFITNNYDLSTDNKDAMIEVIGAAHTLMLDLPAAAKAYSSIECETLRKQRLEECLDITKWQGRYPELVKELGQNKLGSEVYKNFLLNSALPHLPLQKTTEGQFYVDDRTTDFILDELKSMGIEPKSALEECVANMEVAGNRNSPLKLIIAMSSGNKKLIDTALKEFQRKEYGHRGELNLAVKQYVAALGGKYLSQMQKGDTDSFFPTASNLFLIENAKGQKEVLKENLRLYVDYSRLDGYNQEKEIYEKIEKARQKKENVLVSHETGSKNIIKFLGSFKAEENEILRFEFFEGKDLSEYTKKENLLSLEESVDIVRNIADTLTFLNSENVLYMDIKDKNFRYSRESREVRMLDFGMSRLIEDIEGATKISDDTKVRSLLSTPQYIPPEWGRNFTAYAKSDIFQLGILFHQLLTGEHPFSRREIYDFKEGDDARESEIIKYALSNMFNDYKISENNISENKLPFGELPELGILICSMLQKDHTLRPSACEVSTILSQYQTQLSQYQTQSKIMEGAKW